MRIGAAIVFVLLVGGLPANAATPAVPSVSAPIAGPGAMYPSPAINIVPGVPAVEDFPYVTGKARRRRPIGCACWRARKCRFLRRRSASSTRAATRTGPVRTPASTNSSRTAGFFPSTPAWCAPTFRRPMSPEGRGQPASRSSAAFASATMSSSPISTAWARTATVCQVARALAADQLTSSTRP